MGKSISIGVLAVSLVLSGCVGRLDTRPERGFTQSDGALRGVSYALPKVRYEVKLTRALAECPGREIDGKPTALKFSVSATATPTYLAGEAYSVDYERLPGWLRTANFEIKHYPNGTLKSIGAGAEDKTGEVINSVAKTALSLATVVGLSSGGGDQELAPPGQLVVCTEAAQKLVDDARQVEKDLKAAAKTLEGFEKDAERFRAAGAADLMDADGKKRYLELFDDINDMEVRIANLVENQDDLTKALGVTNEVTWDGGVTTPEYAKSYALSPSQRKKLAALLVVGPPPEKYPRDDAEAKRRTLMVPCYGDDADEEVCLDRQLTLQSGVYLERDLKKCSTEGADDLECRTEVGFGDPRYLAARDAEPDSGVFIREPMVGRLLFCRTVLLTSAEKEEPECTVAEDEAKIAAADFPQFGQLRFLPLSVGLFQAREMALSMTATGRLESFTYKSTKAPGQGLAASVADVAAQYEAYREKRETERRDDAKSARETEIAELQLEIDRITKEKQLKELRSPPKVDPLEAVRDETAREEAWAALDRAKLARKKAEEELAALNTE